MKLALTLAAAIAIALAACGPSAAPTPEATPTPERPPTAAEITADAPQGVMADKRTDDIDEVLGFARPEGIEAGLADASHVIGDKATYTVYVYDSDSAANFAFSAWEEGKIGTMFGAAWMEGTGIPDGLGESAVHLTAPAQGIHRFVSLRGPYVVDAVSQDVDIAASVASELDSRLPQ